jgi:hypothetical protein
MVSVTVDFDAMDELSCDSFEKITRKYRWWMPSRKTRAAQSASVRTPASRRISRELSRNAGGKHRRCRPTWN